MVPLDRVPAMTRFVLLLMMVLSLTVAACSDDPEEEAVGETTTATAESMASPSTSAQSATPVPEGTLWRWGNVTIIIPDDSGIGVSPDVAALAGVPMAPFRLDKLNLDEPLNSSLVLIDANNGTVVERHVLAKDAPLIDSVLATITIGPLDPDTAGWPYREQPTPDLPRLSLAHVSYIRPSPDSGIYVGGGLGDPGGPFIDIRNGRSTAFARIGVDGSLEFDTSLTLEEDMPVFQRWLNETKRCDVDIDC